MARLLIISSQVMRGRVGGSLAMPALECLGHEVWALPTVLLSTRPGYGTVEKQTFTPDTMMSFAKALEKDGALQNLDGVLTGYFPSNGHVEAAASIVQQIKAANAECVYVCDPVMGDTDKGLYIAEDAAAAVRDQLVPLADIITPNRFEMNWLTGETGPIDAARALGTETTIITSAEMTETQIYNLLISAGNLQKRGTKRFENVPNGTGDLFSALILHGLSCHAPPQAAFAAACEILEAVAQDSQNQEILQFSRTLTGSH
ncbi:MAG: pyridoxal kinase [Hyphomicrobiales bacterium]